MSESKLIPIERWGNTCGPGPRGSNAVQLTEPVNAEGLGSYLSTIYYFWTKSYLSFYPGQFTDREHL